MLTCNKHLLILIFFPLLFGEGKYACTDVGSDTVMLVTEEIIKIICTKQ